MKNTKLTLCLLVFAALVLGACAPRALHPGFDKFLKEHPTALRKADLNVGYNIDQESMEMQYIFKSFTAGGGLVMPGLMLKDYLETNAQQAFNSLKADPEETQPVQLKFHINSYTFEDFMAHVDLHVSAYRNGSLLFEKNYKAEGQKQAGKMFWGGAWAQRHAVHQSTQTALDSIMNALAGDLQ